MLLTGFAPFGGETVNPSWQVARALDGAVVAGHTVRAVELPCVFADAPAAMQRALRRWRPRAVLALGQAGGRCDFSLERVAINVVDARIADNAGAQPLDGPVVAGAPAAYFATLPVKAVVQALRAAGLPASLSHSAGTFVCNQVFFALMHALRRRRGVRAGFLHLPLLPEQAARFAAQPSLPLATMVDGVRLALAALLTADEIRAVGGTLD